MRCATHRLHVGSSAGERCIGCIGFAIAPGRGGSCSECRGGLLSCITTDVHSTAGIEAEMGITRGGASRNGKRKRESRSEARVVPELAEVNNRG
jgi:hypothetical protein